MFKSYFLATASICSPSPKSVHAEHLGKIPRSSLEEQQDLTKLIAVLVSTGINRNDDVFIGAELLPVRATGAHKPVTYEHDPNQIIGHMIRTYATEKDGTIVPDDMTPTEPRFDITAEAVLYSFLFPELVDDIKRKASMKNLFVSVEVWFKDYDYLVGTQRVKRNQMTASELEHRLRINGGAGEYEGKRIGRILKNMIIGGIGVVEDPANLESVIKSVAYSNSDVVQNIENEIIYENIQENLIGSSKEEKMVPKKIVEETVALASAIKASNQHGLIKSEATISDLVQRVETLENKNQELENSAKEVKQKAEAARRKSILEGIVNESTLEQHLSHVDGMTNESFESYVSLLRDTLEGNKVVEQKMDASFVEEVTDADVAIDVVDADLETEVEDDGQATLTDAMFQVIKQYRTKSKKNNFGGK